MKTYNVEVTGAARLYRAASVWTAGLGFSFPQPIKDSGLQPLNFYSQKVETWEGFSFPRSILERLFLVCTRKIKDLVKLHFFRQTGFPCQRSQLLQVVVHLSQVADSLPVLVQESLEHKFCRVTKQIISCRRVTSANGRGCLQHPCGLQELS